MGSSVGPDDALVRRLGGEVTRSERVRRLLSERRSDGTIPFHPYRAKWYGAHWVLVALADLGHPRGDRSLIPFGSRSWPGSSPTNTRPG